MGAPQLELIVNPQEFFQERVSSAIAKQKVELSKDLEFYVVNLLCDYIDYQKLINDSEVPAFDTPLAIALKNAIEAPAPQQLKLFKQLGDTSLYVSGFFQDYFNRKAVDVSYYIALGSNAYERISSLMCDAYGDDHFKDIYQNLSSKFGDLVEVVAEVADSSSMDNPKNLLSLYDRWTRNNSDRIRRQLEEVGITPVPSSSTKKQ